MTVFCDNCGLKLAMEKNLYGAMCLSCNHTTEPLEPVDFRKKTLEKVQGIVDSALDRHIDGENNGN